MPFMNCPVCKNIVLLPGQLEDNLPARGCSRCGGRWVAGVSYWRWLEQRGQAVDDSAPAAQAEVHDSAPAKLCPECGRFLTRCKVGHGVDFHLDRCANCSGFWFDANEWEILKARALHDDVHFVFSAAWQAQLAQTQRHEAHEQILLEKLGQADFEEIRRIKAWLDAHPRRTELYAHLLHAS
jgi:Zn-finger nucleic acid-binding protein